MRVVHVVSSLDPKVGGPVVALLGLVEAQLNQGIEVTVASTFTAPFDDGAATRLRELGAAVVLVGPAGGPLGSHPDLVPKLREAIATTDVVHIHAVWEEIQHRAAQVARQLKKPYLFRPCGMLDPWQLRQGRLKKALYLLARLKSDLNGAAGIHFTSAEERRLVLPLGLKAPAIVEANGVKVNQAATPDEVRRFREEFGLADGEKILLFLGRIHHKKGFDFLIPALGQASLSGVKLVVAGPDENNYRAEVEQLIAAHGVREQVIFTGALEGAHKRAALSAAHLFVLSSYQENFGNAVVEALAAGTPVLISDQVNIYPEIAAARVGGVVPLNVDALASALNLWLADGEPAAGAAQRSVPFVRENYDWNQIAARWRQRYQLLADGGSLS